MTLLRQLPTKPAAILCFDFQGDLQLVEHLIGRPLLRAGKTENIHSRLDADDAWRTSRSTGASITPCTTSARMPVRIRGNAMRLYVDFPP